MPSPPSDEPADLSLRDLAVWLALVEARLSDLASQAVTRDAMVWTVLVVIVAVVTVLGTLAALVAVIAGLVG